MECEMQAREFFVHIGTLIIEGRTPQQSDKGRVEGPHCLSLFSVVPHVCNPQVNSVSALFACSKRLIFSYNMEMKLKYSGWATTIWPC